MATLFAATPVQAQRPAASPRYPNVVILLADDWGFTDVGAFGAEFATPNIDALARTGVRFSNFHVAGSCSPTRAMLQTGVMSHRAGIGNMPEAIPDEHRGKPGYDTVMNHRVVTIGQMFQAAGAKLPSGRLLDSEDILAGPAQRDAIFWRSGDYRAVRAGDWKLQLTKRPEKARLYNLATDPTEQTDLAAREPARVAELRTLIESQNAGMAKPIWPGLVEGPVRIDVPLNAPWRDGQDYIYWTN